MAPFDRYLELIGQLVNINDEDREISTSDFDAIRDYVFRMLRGIDANFRIICKGPSLFGSYSNNVRIRSITEFDVHIRLSFPFSKYILIEEDEDRPGYVNLDFTDVMEELENANGYDDLFERMEDLVDTENGYLRRSNLAHWIQDIFEEAMSTYLNHVRTPSGRLYKLEYSKRGLAHTIYAHGQNCPNISIDFVPAIMFGCSEWANVRNEHPFKYKCDRWYAIPKPTFGPISSRKYAFMICCPKVEHDLLLGKQNLKVIFRLLKSLRDQYKIRRLKSYFITTAFLWEIEDQPKSFWYRPLGEILIHMLGKICDYFIEGDLPFFWNDDLNLLEPLCDDEIDNYCEKLCNAYNTLKTYYDQPRLSYSRCKSHFKILD